MSLWTHKRRAGRLGALNMMRLSSVRTLLTFTYLKTVQWPLLNLLQNCNIQPRVISPSYLMNNELLPSGKS